jgi:pimeloyl-ACP methyl ester carboxylesterase
MIPRCRSALFHRIRFASVNALGGGVSRIFRLSFLFATAGLWLGVFVANAAAQQVTLDDGMVLDGKPVPIQGLNAAVARQQAGEIPSYRILMIDTGVKRYFVPSRRAVDVNLDADLSRFESFEKTHLRSGGRGATLQAVGTFIEMTEFDEDGRRRVTVATPGEPLPIIQGITKITPKTITVTSLNLNWEYGIATTSLPLETLDRILRKIVDWQNPDDRRAIVRFYLQAGMYPKAQYELNAIARDFPELAPGLKELSVELTQLQAQRLLEELRQRRQAGQHELALATVKQFPVDEVGAVVLKEVRDLIAEYQSRREQIEKARGLLGELQAQLEKSEDREAVMPLRSVVIEQLDYESIDRLDAFLKLEIDDTLSPEEKLGLAYSGWVLGSAEAVPDLDSALRYWQARFYILEYLRSDDYQQRQRMLDELLEVEDVSSQLVAKLIPYLPPIIETPNARAGHALTIDVPPDRSQVPATYSVLLPLDYNPNHRYPMIVALRPARRPHTDELLWWGGSEHDPLQSQRHGYIVIAPDYAAADQKAYDYNASAHHIVLQSIRDARKRFSVDSDRIFLSGHGMGGDAAFDIGMSHPDVFAGVIPIAGASDQFCKYYWENGKNVGWYVVAGERDPHTMSRNDRELNRMLRYNFDIVYSEYIARGYESYYAEIHHLFAWMKSRQRVKYPKEVEASTLRTCDNRFFWLTADGLPFSTESIFKEDKSRRARPIRPLSISAKATPGNTIHVSSGAAKHTIWLSPEIIDLDSRISVRVNGRPKFNNFVDHLGRPAIEAMLDDLGERGDRQKLYWGKLEF